MNYIDLVEELYNVYLDSPNVLRDSRDTHMMKDEPFIFFAGKGPECDSHIYLNDVFESNCSIAVIDNPNLVDVEYADGEIRYGQYERYFLVPDSYEMLIDLAMHHRKMMLSWNVVPKVIGITGTSGKTTTKELVNAVLSAKYNTIMTYSNDNQEGAAQTFLSIHQGCEFAIVELGSNHPKDIQWLCEVTQPDYCILTNVGKAHLLALGSAEGVKQSKQCMYDYVKENGKNVFISNNEKLQEMLGSYKGAIEYRKSEVVSCNRYLSLKYGDTVIETNLVGSYNKDNVDCAVTVGTFFVIGIEKIKKALEEYRPINLRSQLVEIYGQNFVLDTYNANPTATRLSIESFSTSFEGKKNLIVGDMFELGDKSIEEHISMLRYLNTIRDRFDRIAIVGEDYLDACVRMVRIGENCNMEFYRDVNEFTTKDHLSTFIGTTLIKGSHGVHFDRLIDKSYYRT